MKSFQIFILKWKFFFVVGLTFFLTVRKALRKHFALSNIESIYKIDWALHREKEKNEERNQSIDRISSDKCDVRALYR